MSSDELFVPHGHFYSPIADREEASIHLKKIEQGKNNVLGIDFDDKAMKSLWGSLCKAGKDIPFKDKKDKKNRYYYVNDQFSYGDAFVYYSQLKLLNPNRVIEIGSGYSSALALDVRENFKLDTKLTFIEPYPTRLNSLLKKSDKSAVSIIEKKVQEVDPKIFEELEEDDILFIDSSHVAKTGSDVCFEIFEILPRLKSGVKVIIHDMFYPFEYPRAWAVDQNRSWNELYFIRAFLMHNSKFSIEFFNHYFALKFPDVAKSKSSLFMKNPGGSLWLKVN